MLSNAARERSIRIHTFHNSLPVEDFLFDVAGNQRCVSYLATMLHIDGNLELSLKYHNGADTNIVIPHPEKYPELLQVLTGELSPKATAEKLGIRFKKTSYFFAEFKDAQKNTIDEDHPLHGLLTLLVFFPRPKTAESYLFFHDNKIKVIDKEMEQMLRGVVYQADVRPSVIPVI